LNFVGSCRFILAGFLFHSLGVLTEPGNQPDGPAPRDRVPATKREMSSNSLSISFLLKVTTGKCELTPIRIGRSGSAFPLVGITETL